MYTKRLYKKDDQRHLGDAVNITKEIRGEVEKEDSCQHKQSYGSR